ncbi:uncharacterized protein LOC6542068 [Drosophila erecta]|uniref:Uncharacterized protein n=1 Tax=Drosophila erecta TaxID=7220 RepID=B3N986_DROER|nr:uncharacterized protein LOC6542068 [Drosophila erecta]EDV59573.1 uncharacterized protein Dere_GG23335 [Drosophila erecta]
MKTKSEKKPPLKNAPRKINGESFPARRIPANVLKRTLEIATSPEDGFWLNQNPSCAPPASYEFYFSVRRSTAYEKLRLARNCLMQRDYKNLAKILASNHLGDTLLQRASFQIFTEYSNVLQKCPKFYTKMDQLRVEPTPPQAESPTVGDKALDESLDAILS